MIILGIDPGSLKTGHAVIEVRNGRATYKASGVLRYDQSRPFLERIGEIYHSFRRIVERERPHEIAIESLIHVRNVSSLAKLAQARGVILSALISTHQGKIFEYLPNQIKAAVTGHGHADKKTVDQTLRMIFARQINFESDDESDALAIALGHHLLGGNTRGLLPSPKRNLRP